MKKIVHLVLDRLVMKLALKVRKNCKVAKGIKVQSMQGVKGLFAV